MAAYLRTLVDENGNIIYPQSKAEAVYMSDNETTTEDAINERMKKTNNRTVSVVAKNKIKIDDVVYTVEGDIDYDNTDIGAETELSDSVFSACFSPDGTSLVLGGFFSGFAKLYSVSGTTITFVSNIYADAGTTALSSTVNSVCFSPDGTSLVLGGFFAGYAKIYSVSGTTITFVSNIYADAGTTALSSTVNSVCFSPDGTLLVLAGSFSGYAKIYSVSGTTITFVSNIYANAGTTALNSMVNSTCFSPDGTSLVLGGEFSGFAKIYSVSGTTITFVSNIYADAGTTALSDSVFSACFSPDGTKLVLGGFTGLAKHYSVSGTSITFVSNIYADAGTTALSETVKTVRFSPNGTKLVLGGFFSGYAKLYSVSETNIAFVSNIYADVGTTALDDTVSSACFSPDGTSLVLGGDFSGNAKLYSVSGTTVTYAPQINYLTSCLAYTSIDAFSESAYFVGVSLSDANVNGSGFAELVFEGRKGEKHADTHASTGTDPLTPAAIGAANNQIDATTAAALGLTGDPTINDALVALGDRAKILNGNYIGTGNYGANNPNSITLPFVPKVIILFGQMASSKAPFWAITALICPSARGVSGWNAYNQTSARLDLTWGLTTTWYSVDNAEQQINMSRQTYYYAAIG